MMDVWGIDSTYRRHSEAERRAAASMPEVWRRSNKSVFIIWSRFYYNNAACEIDAFLSFIVSSPFQWIIMYRSALLRSIDVATLESKCSKLWTTQAQSYAAKTPKPYVQGINPQLACSPALHAAASSCRLAVRNISRVLEPSPGSSGWRGTAIVGSKWARLLCTL